MCVLADARTEANSVCSRPLKIAGSILILAASAAVSAQSKTQRFPATGKIDVRVLHAIHEPEESTVSYVTTSVTIRSDEVSFVVPTCSGDEREPVFCMASVRRSNGKAVPVRKGLSATLGVEDAKSWKPIVVAKNGAIELQFSIDLGLLDVRAGEAVRLAFWIWPDVESLKDPNKGKMVLSPVFRIPVKPE